MDDRAAHGTGGAEGADDDAPLDGDEAAAGAAAAGETSDETLAERLAVVLEELLEADDAAPVEEAETDGGVELRAGGRAFAVVGGDALEVRLDPPVLRAALGTPDASPSPRGPGWLRFRPATPDRFALDRAEAWLRLAHRRATGG